MFFQGSRYQDLGTYPALTGGGQTVMVTRLPRPRTGPLAGFHRRQEGERLDHLANRFVNNPTAFWQLADANNALVPDALGSSEIIGIPLV